MDTNAEGPQEPGWVRRALIGRDPSRTAVRIVVLVTVTFLVSKFVLLPIRVEGISMLPTYPERGVNAISRLSYVFHEPRRGDVVGIRLAGEHVMLLKRIVALPGETVAFHHGRLVVNGRFLDEPYVKRQCFWEIPPEKVDPDKYYVVGDNRDMNAGEHTKGQAERRRIVGKILL